MTSLLKIELDNFPEIIITHYKKTKKGDVRLRKIRKKVWDIDSIVLEMDKKGTVKFSIENKRWEETHHEKKTKRRKTKTKK